MSEQIKIYISDITYDSQEYSQFSEAEASQKYKTKLEKELNCTLTPVNIGAGADWPAFVLEMTLENKELIALMALFLAGEKIDKNIDAWISIGKKVGSLVSQTNGRLNKAAASLFSLNKVSDIYQSKEKISSIQIISYTTFDLRFTEQEKQPKTQADQIEKGPKGENIGSRGHNFAFKVNDKLLRIHIIGNEITIKHENR